MGFTCTRCKPGKDFGDSAADWMQYIIHLSVKHGAHTLAAAEREKNVNAINKAKRAARKAYKANQKTRKKRGSSWNW